jgi:hypothetical protein
VSQSMPREPIHVHVRKGSAIAKFGVDPEVALADSWGMSSKELKTLKSYIEQNSDHIREYWNEYFKL